MMPTISSASQVKPFTPRQAWVMVICASAFYCFQFLLRVAPSVLTEQLKISFDVNSCELGFLGACYYNAYALMQIPIGIVLDRFNIRYIISLSCGTAALGTIIFALSDTLFVAGIGRFLMGMGAACGFIGTLKIASLCIDKRYTVRAVAIAMIFGTCGGTLGSAPLALLTNYLTWRTSLLLIAGIGLCLTVLLYITLKPLEQLRHTSTLRINFATFADQLARLVKIKQFWLLSIFGMLMYVPLSAFADLWGAAFVALKYAIDPVLAASLVSLIYLGVAIGTSIFSTMAEKLRHYQLPMILSSLMITLCYHYIIYSSSLSIELFGGLLLCAGISFGGQCLVFSALSEKVSPSSYGFACGFMNMIIMMSGVVFEPLIGALLDSNSQLDIVTYTTALQPILIALCSAIAISLFIRVKYPRYG